MSLMPRLFTSWRNNICQTLDNLEDLVNLSMDPYERLCIMKDGIMHCYQFHPHKDSKVGRKLKRFYRKYLLYFVDDRPLNDYANTNEPKTFEDYRYKDKMSANWNEYTVIRKSLEKSIIAIKHYLDNPHNSYDIRSHEEIAAVMEASTAKLLNRLTELSEKSG